MTEMDESATGRWRVWHVEVDGAGHWITDDDDAAYFRAKGCRVWEYTLTKYPDGWVPEHDATSAAKVLGSAGGKKGGRARAASLSPEERSAIARKAANARWSKR